MSKLKFLPRSTANARDSQELKTKCAQGLPRSHTFHAASGQVSTAVLLTGG